MHYDVLAVEFCSDFTCPRDYSLVDDADTVECEDTGCSKETCCERDGEASTVP